MVTASLPPSEARRLRAEFENSIVKFRQDIPDIMALERPAFAIEAKPSIKDIPVKMVESTLNRIWGDEGRLEVKDFDEKWKPDKPEVALIKTNAGERVLKTEKPPTGQDGIVNEGMAPLFYAELNLKAVRMGVDGLKYRG